jgi:hypothetical protein
MFITNEMNYGHLIDPENFNVSLNQPELYEIFNNVKVNLIDKQDTHRYVDVTKRIGKRVIFIRIIIEH